MTAFTDRFIKGLKPAQSFYEEYDSGCPGLLIRVGKRGKKVFEVVVSSNGRCRCVRLGVYPQISLAAARRMASERKNAPDVHTAGLKVKDLWARYRDEKASTLRSWSDVETAWRKWAEPLIGEVRLQDLTARHGGELISQVMKKTSAGRAAKVVRYINPALSYAVGRGYLSANPWRDLQTPTGYEPRARVLSLDEWRTLHQWALEDPHPFRPFHPLADADWPAKERMRRAALG